jgi:K(+)-stimulated pyrophosphate-energized sodium pump
MAPDLLESYSVMLVASLILGKTVFSDKSLVLPLIVAMIGIITVVIGSSGSRRQGDCSGMTAINRASSFRW